jgi:hypothetical protein
VLHLAGQALAARQFVNEERRGEFRVALEKAKSRAAESIPDREESLQLIDETAEIRTSIESAFVNLTYSGKRDLRREVEESTSRIERAAKLSEEERQRGLQALGIRVGDPKGSTPPSEGTPDPAAAQAV